MVRRVLMRKSSLKDGVKFEVDLWFNRESKGFSWDYPMF